MAIDFSGLSLADLADLVLSNCRCVLSPTTPVPQEFAWPRDHHERGEAQDISFRSIQASTFTVPEFDEAPLPAEEVMRNIREIQERISHEMALDAFAHGGRAWYDGIDSEAFRDLRAREAMRLALLRPDRPPALAAPSSRLPSYRPR